MEHTKDLYWIKTPPNLDPDHPFLKALPLRPIDNHNTQYQIKTKNGKTKLCVPNDCRYQLSGQTTTFEDMCKMSILNEPEVLNNLIERYKNDQIFTLIGSILIAINPYRYIESQFGDPAFLLSRDQIINQKLKPHVYSIAGQAYTHMLKEEKKQAIVVSGESGAGKTESAKHCMKMLASLSHKQNHPIQNKILACNPLLQLFGNSKTLKNDNSSRFGKYIQILFGKHNTIEGANIQSYLLEKSRVVSIAKGERTFHAFYALLASGKFNCLKPNQYDYLAASETYQASQDDRRSYLEVTESMTQIGFTIPEQQKIWRLLLSILQLGNIKFNDDNHVANQSCECQIVDRENLVQIASTLQMRESDLEKLLLSEKKRFLKQVAYIPYNNKSIRSNLNTLSKAIYTVIFQFIIHRIQISLKPSVNCNYKSISLLDIFGFENFETNSFEQLCINFTNQKLLKLYNKSIFEDQMQLLSQDGLADKIKGITPPVNDGVLNLINGKLSLFSLINDYTTPQQFTDEDIMHGFSSKLITHRCLQLDKINKNKFTIRHSQCDVVYNIVGFKAKNQDKVNEDIEGIVNRLFSNQTKEQVGKTILNKFKIQIEDLIAELDSSNVYFIRCIKPNSIKQPNSLQLPYILKQIRYLGVFETIQIRRSTYPWRKTYSEFLNRYSAIFPKSFQKDQRIKVQNILKTINVNQRDYLLGKQKVYLSNQIEEYLQKQLYKSFQVYHEKVILIQRFIRKRFMREEINTHLKILLKRKAIWKNIANKHYALLSNYGFKAIVKQNQTNLKDNNKQRVLLRAAQIMVLTIYAEPFHIIKSIPSQYDKLYETIIVEDNGTVTPDLYKTVERLPNIAKVAYEQQKEYQSIVSQDYRECIFRGSFVIAPMEIEEQNANLQRLVSIICDCYTKYYQEESLSPASLDCQFELIDTNPNIMNEIIMFPIDSFFQGILLKRTNFLGIQKQYTDILKSKSKGLSKSLTALSPNDEKLAIQAFGLLVKIGQENQIENLFTIILNIIKLCQDSSQALKNEVFIQILRQSNNSVDVLAARILQTLSVFIHVYDLPSDFLLAALHIFQGKLNELKSSSKLLGFMKFIFKRILRKYEKSYAGNGYIPIKYQIIALMCRKQISVPVHLSVGSSVMVQVEAFQSFKDIRSKTLKEFGINEKRIPEWFFSFFLIKNQKERGLQESLIDENFLVWDMMAYLQILNSKNVKDNNPQKIFIMLKLKYAFQLYIDDLEGIELCYCQCYFDYFSGKLKLVIDKVAQLAACVKMLKYKSQLADQIIGVVPSSLLQKLKKSELLGLIEQRLSDLRKLNLDSTQLKWHFIKVCAESELAMALQIPTSDKLRLFLKTEKLMIFNGSNLLNIIKMNMLLKWGCDGNQLTLQARENSGSITLHTFHTQFANSFFRYITQIKKGKTK